jgi:subtilisin family serine protease
MGSPSYDNGNYQTISGTSMATPYVAGVVAQLAQAEPTITPGRGEEILENTAHEFTAGAGYEADPRNTASETSFDKGHGLVDVLSALARLQGRPTPAEPTPICTSSSPQVSDPENDATQVVAADVNPQSQADLDITSASLSWDAASRSSPSSSR